MKLTNKLGAMDDTCRVADRLSIKANSARQDADSLPRRLLMLLVLALVCRMATALDAPARHVSDTPRHICSKKSDIFYNASLSESHRVVKRDDERDMRPRRRENKKVQDGEEEEDIDIDPDQQPEPPLTPFSSSSGPGSGCGACRPREVLRKHSLELIKNEILSKLGMTQPPNLTGRFRPEFGLNYLLAKYESDTRGSSRNQYPLRRHAHSHSHHSNGLHWVTPDDESIQMQSDAPSDR